MKHNCKEEPRVTRLSCAFGTQRWRQDLCGVLVILAGWLCAVSVQAQEQSPGLWGQQAERGGFHFKAAFGTGIGPTSLGLWHSMEIGGTFQRPGILNGWTMAYHHVFLLSAPQFRPNDAADMFGGHFFLLKIPLGLPEIVAKLSVGLGESVDLRTGFQAFFGFGWHYGIDFHFPWTRRSGMTIGLDAVHSITGRHGHIFGFGLNVGYTWF